MKQTSKTLQLKAVLLASVGVFCALPAQGQDLAVEEIIVTARQRAESLLDTPIAITAYQADQIERLNIQTIEDLAKFTPGLTITRSSQSNGTKINIRGLQTDLGRSPVAIRVDEMDLTSESVYSTGIGWLANQRLMNLERIEVVKGAQVALYGRAAFGGAINYITKRPSLDGNEWTAGIDINSEQEYEAKASFSGPAIEDRLAIGFNASYFHDGGSYKNQLNGKKLGTGEGVGVAGSFLLTPNDDLSIYSRVEYSQDKRAQEAGSIIEPETIVSLPANVAAIVGRDSALVLTGKMRDVRESEIFLQVDPFSGENFSGADTETTYASLIVDYDLGEVAFKSLTGWLELQTSNRQSTTWQETPYTNNGVPDINGGINPGGFTTQMFDIFNTDRIFNQELRLYSNNDSRLQWQIGGLYWEEEVDQGQDQPTLLPIVPVTTDLVVNFLRQRVGDHTRTFGRDTYHYSAYAWFEYDVTDQFAVSAEIRYNDEKSDYFTNDTVNVSIALPPVDDPSVLQVSVIPPDQSPARVSQNFTTPKFTLTYEPTEEHTLYASAAKSIKPAGHATSSADQFTEFNRFETEKLWSYEIGWKGRLLDNRLSANTAFFYQDYTNQQVNSTVFDTQSQVPRGATVNAGKSRRWGIELEGLLQTTENFTVSGGYVYNNTKFQEYEFFTSSAISAAQGPCIREETFLTPDGQAVQTGCIISWTGNRAGQVPKHQFSVTGNYTAPLNDTYDWFTEANLRYVGKRHLNNSNLRTAQSYARVDVRAGVTSENVSAWLYANNLLDDKTAENVSSYLSYVAGGFPPAALVYLPDPITVGLRFGYSM